MKTKPLTFLLSLTFLFLFSGSVYGQGAVKKEYWDNGKLRLEIPYNGLGTWWYESGEKYEEMHYKNGRKDGLATYWRRSGAKTAEIYYKNGNRDGVATAWYPSGQKLIERHWKNGIRDGRETLWHKNCEHK